MRREKFFKAGSGHRLRAEIVSAALVAECSVG